MFTSSVDAGFVLALPFAGWGGLMHIKIPLQDFALKMQGGAYARGGAYLRDTTVHVVWPMAPSHLHVGI